jgi:hypothetical protein
LISRGGLLTELEAPYVAEAERLERFDSGSGERRFDIIKLPHIGGGLVNSVVNMSNSIIGAGKSLEGVRYAEFRNYWVALCFQSSWTCAWPSITIWFDGSGGLDYKVLLLIDRRIVDVGRLIVVNAKLSGSSSYQDTVAACFGHGGLVCTFRVPV